MSTTLAEKIIANASGRSTVRAGEILTARLDLLMMHDSGGPRRVAGRLDKLGARVWDPDKVVVVSDHFVPAVDMESAEILALTRRWARDHGVVVASDAQFTRRSKAGPLREVPQRFGWPCWKRMKRQSDFGVLSASLSIGALGQTPSKCVAIAG